MPYVVLGTPPNWTTTTAQTTQTMSVTSTWYIPTTTTVPTITTAPNIIVAYVQDIFGQYHVSYNSNIAEAAMGIVEPPIASPAIISPKEVESAEAKARALLLSFLDFDQKEKFEKDRSFVMVGKSGRRFRINWGRVGNIELLQAEGEVWQERYCVHPIDGTLPTPDVMLGQMLALAHDDEATLRIANLSGRNPEFPNIPRRN